MPRRETIALHARLLRAPAMARSKTFHCARHSSFQPTRTKEKPTSFEIRLSFGQLHPWSFFVKDACAISFASKPPFNTQAFFFVFLNNDEFDQPDCRNNPTHQARAGLSPAAIVRYAEAKGH
jgi:hypothetical protein